jgi:hypothetical protein
MERKLSETDVVRVDLLKPFCCSGGFLVLCQLTVCVGLDPRYRGAIPTRYLSVV